MSPPVCKPTLYFYRKSGCCLCDEMACGLVEFRRGPATDLGIQFEIVERDIEDDPGWYQRYREYVPMLVLGQREICYYFLDQDELKAALLDNA